MNTAAASHSVIPQFACYTVLDGLQIGNGLQLSIACGGMLMGYAWVGPTDTGYEIRRVQKLTAQPLDISAVVLARLSVRRFRKLLAA